jgi:hypothetical protein
MKYLLLAPALFVLSASSIRDYSSPRKRNVSLQGTEREVKWTKLRPKIPWTSSPEDSSFWATALPHLDIPADYVFVPVYCAFVPTFDEVPIVSDNGTVEGHLGLHGFTFVFYPFLPETDDPRLIRTRDVRWFPPGLVLAEPWDGNSVYLFGFSDTPEIRARVESSDSIATLLSLTELVFELEIER